MLSLAFILCLKADECVELQLCTVVAAWTPVKTRLWLFFPEGGGVTDFVLFALILFDLVISVLVVNVIEFTATEDLRSAVYMRPERIRSGVYLHRHTSRRRSVFFYYYYF